MASWDVPSRYRCMVSKEDDVAMGISGDGMTEDGYLYLRSQYILRRMLADPYDIPDDAFRELDTNPSNSSKLWIRTCQGFSREKLVDSIRSRINLLEEDHQGGPYEPAMG